MSWLMASLHFLALALGSIAIYSRGKALAELKTPLHIIPQVKSVLRYDTLWGVAFLLWLLSGFSRIFFEKGSEFYTHNPLFHAKMGFFILIVLIEIKPMLTFLSWRKAIKAEKHITISADQLDRLIKMNKAQNHTLYLIIFLATGMLRFGI